MGSNIITVYLSGLLRKLFVYKLVFLTLSRRVVRLIYSRAFLDAFFSRSSHGFFDLLLLDKIYRHPLQTVFFFEVAVYIENGRSQKDIQ